MASIRAMNGQPLRYAVLAQAEQGNRFFRGSHTSIERARAMVRQDLRPTAPITREWTFWIVELAEPAAVNGHQAQVVYTIIDGPYQAGQRPPAPNGRP
jgi:hypothetical protein